MIEANKIHHNVGLKDFNSWRVGGIARNFYICTDKNILSGHIKSKLMEYPLYFIGLGSNTLVRDGLIKGTIVLMRCGYAPSVLRANGRIWYILASA